MAFQISTALTNNPLAKEMVNNLKAGGMSDYDAWLMVKEKSQDNIGALTALHLAARPAAGVVNDVTVDRTILLRQVDEELPNGLRRTLREAEYRDIVRLTSDARNAK